MHKDKNSPEFSPTQTRIALIVVIILLLIFPISRIIITSMADNSISESNSDDSEQIDDELLIELIEGYNLLSRQDQDKLLIYMKTLLNPEETQQQVDDEEVISWLDADQYYGETVTIEGIVVASYNSGKACFLNFHEDYSSYFTAVIFQSDFENFPDSPEDYYYGKTVRITGKIKEYQDSPEIILESTDQIEIVE